MNLDEIRKDIESAKDDLKSITHIESNDSAFNINLAQENLKNLLERINASIEECFNEFPNSGNECLLLLDEVLGISEEFKQTYICPASYEGSNDISSTYKDIEKKMIEKKKKKEKKRN